MALGCPAQAAVFNQMSSKDPFQPQPSCDFVACQRLLRAGPDQGHHTHLQLFDGGICPSLIPWWCPFTWVSSQNGICENGFAGWDCTTFSRTSFGCASLTSAFMLCPQQQSYELSRVAEKCVWTPTQRLGNRLATGLPQARGTGCLSKGSTFGWYPRLALLRKPVKDKFQAFKESNQKKVRHFQGQMLGGIKTEFYSS